MPLFRDERRVRHNAAEMFDLVADVELYPEFVPLCKALKVRSRKPETDGRETLVADMTVGYKLIHETFTSRVLLDKPRLKVVVRYIDGPFSRLENVWTFKDEAESESSRVLGDALLPQAIHKKSDENGQRRKNRKNVVMKLRRG